MVNLYSLLYQLESMGFYEFVLPFLLIFTVIFAVLEKSQIFGVFKTGTGATATSVPKTNINLLFSAVLGLMLIINTDVIILMNNYLSKMALIIVMSIMMMLLIATVTGKSGDNIAAPFGLAAIIAVGAAIWSFIPYQYGYNRLFDVSNEVVSVMLLIGLSVAFVVWIKKR